MHSEGRPKGALRPEGGRRLRMLPEAAPLQARRLPDRHRSDPPWEDWLHQVLHAQDVAPANQLSAPSNFLSLDRRFSALRKCQTLAKQVCWKTSSCDVW